MKSENNFMKSLFVLALLVSVSFNIFLVSGCEITKIEYVEKVDRMKNVAKKLGMRGSPSDKTADAIERSIGLWLNEKRNRDIPEPLSDETIAELKKLLRPEERVILDAYQRTIKDAQGKRVLYLPVDGE